METVVAVWFPHNGATVVAVWFPHNGATVVAVWFPHNGATVVAVRLDLIAHYSFSCRFPLL